MDQPKVSKQERRKHEGPALSKIEMKTSSRFHGILGSKRFSLPLLVTYEVILNFLEDLGHGHQDFHSLEVIFHPVCISEVPCGQTEGATLAKAQRVVKWYVLVTSWWVFLHMTWLWCDCDLASVSWTSRNHCHAVIISIIQKMCFHHKRITNHWCKYKQLQLGSITWHVFSIGASLEAGYLLVFCPCPLYTQKCIGTPIICRCDGAWIVQCQIMICTHMRRGTWRSVLENYFGCMLFCSLSLLIYVM